MKAISKKEIATLVEFTRYLTASRQSDRALWKNSGPHIREVLLRFIDWKSEVVKRVFFED
jgi:hypothetical protein